MYKTSVDKNGLSIRSVVRCFDRLKHEMIYTTPYILRIEFYFWKDEQKSQCWCRHGSPSSVRSSSTEVVRERRRGRGLQIIWHLFVRWCLVKPEFKWGASARAYSQKNCSNWYSHGAPIFPRCSNIPMVLQYSHGAPVYSHGVPIFPWCSNIPMVLPIFPWCSSIFPWCSSIFPWCSSIFPWCSNIPMVFQYSHGAPIFPWCSSIFPWCSSIFPWSVPIFPWCSSIFPWCSSTIHHGAPVYSYGVGNIPMVFQTIPMVLQYSHGVPIFPWCSSIFPWSVYDCCNSSVTLGLTLHLPTRCILVGYIVAALIEIILVMMCSETWTKN